jgi:ribokinase
MPVRRPRIAVVGAVGVGLVYQIGRMPEKGETLIADSLRIMPGGKASNHAIGALRLGADALVLSAVGSDIFSGYIRRILNESNVDTSAIVEVADECTLVGSVLVDAAADNWIVLATGALNHFRAEHLEASATRIAECDVCLVSLEMPAEPAVRGLKIAREHGLTTVLNPAPAPCESDVKELLPLCDWVIPNLGEAQTMTGYTSPEDAAKALLQQGARNAIVTLGADGALVLVDGIVSTVPADSVPVVVDTSGAGDAFNVAFSVACALGVDPLQAVRHGCRAAGRIVQAPGFFTALHLWRDLQIT